MQFILNCLEKALGGLGGLVVVDATLLVDIRDFEVETALARPDFPDALDELIEVVRTEADVELEAFVVQHETFDDELSKCVGCPDTKLRRLRAVDTVPNRDNRIEVVVADFARN